MNEFYDDSNKNVHICKYSKTQDQPVKEVFNQLSKENELYAEGNQIVGLISFLLSLRSWKLAKELIDLLKNISNDIDIMDFTVIRDALCDLLLWATSEIYYPLGFKKLSFNSKNGNKDAIYDKRSIYYRSTDDMKRIILNKDNLNVMRSQQMEMFRDLSTFPRDIVPLLHVLQHNISSSSVLFTRICRLLEAHIKLETPTLIPTNSIRPGLFTGSKTETNDKEVVLKLKDAIEIISVVLLPGLTVSTNIPFFSLQLWRMLSLLPFQIRFSLYDSWKGKGLAKEGLGHKSTKVVMAETEISHNTRYYLKRLAKENVKSIGVKIGALSHVMPIVVYNQVLSQIEAYENMIPYIVDALKCSTKLSNDVMAYCIINQLGKDGDKLKKGDLRLYVYICIYF